MDEKKTRHRVMVEFLSEETKHKLAARARIDELDSSTVGRVLLSAYARGEITIRVGWIKGKK